MKHIIVSISTLLLGGFTFACPALAQPFALQSEPFARANNEPRPVYPIPSARQLKWQQTEFYAFFHYGMNTYTNKEWGYGNEDERLFAPTAAPSPRQWLEAVKAAGMKGGIAVVKHHDGFCLWPTQTTTHSVVKAGNDWGKAVNIPRDFAQAARQLGMKYGFYVSPWDRNSEYYGTRRYVTDVFLRQCAELAQYGTDQFEMWFDGANGGDGWYGGRDTTVSVHAATYYDMPNLRDTLHRVCPDMVMWGMGGEARWIGNEAGWSGETCWSPENRGYAPESNGMYGAEEGLFWLPGESDAKFTNKGWFWHEGERPLSAERAFQMYLETVGRNATLILNCPPDRSGRLPQATVDSLRALGQLLRTRLGRDLAPAARITASSVRTAGKQRHYRVSQLMDGKFSTYWATPDDVHSATLTLRWKKPQTLRYLLLQENIALGQRIRRFHVEVSTDGRNFHPVAKGVTTTTVGYKRIVPLNGSTAHSFDAGQRALALRVVIEDSRACPTLSTLSVY